MYGGSDMETCITMCRVDSQWEFAVWLHRGSVLAWRGGMGREVWGKFQKGGDIMDIMESHG